MINIKRILCPTDLSPYSGNAVRYALALARSHDAELIVLHCTDNPAGEEELQNSVREYVDPSFSRCRFVVAPAERVDEEIMMQAQTERVD
jgi:nucleotide-binding universal stress UspA family protein